MSRRPRPFHGGPCFRHRGRGIAVGPRGAAARPSPEQGSPPVGAGVEVMGPRNAVACPRTVRHAPGRHDSPHSKGICRFGGTPRRSRGRWHRSGGQAALTGGGPAAGPTRALYAASTSLVTMTSTPRPRTSAIVTSPSCTGAGISTSRIAAITSKMRSLGIIPERRTLASGSPPVVDEHRGRDVAHRVLDLLGHVGLVLGALVARDRRDLTAVQLDGDIAALRAHDAGELP